MLQIYLANGEWTDDDIVARTEWRMEFLRDTYGL